MPKTAPIQNLGPIARRAQLKRAAQGRKSLTGPTAEQDLADPVVETQLNTEAVQKAATFPGQKVQRALAEMQNKPRQQKV